MAPSKNYTGAIPYSPVSPLSPMSSAPSTPCKFVHVDPATFQALSRDSPRKPNDYIRSRSGPIISNSSFVDDVPRQAMSGPLASSNLQQQQQPDRLAYSGVIRSSTRPPLRRSGSVPIPSPPRNNCQNHGIHSGIIMGNSFSEQPSNNAQISSNTQSSSINGFQSPRPFKLEPTPLPTPPSIPQPSRQTKLYLPESLMRNGDRNVFRAKPDLPSSPKPTAYKLPPPPLGLSVRSMPSPTSEKPPDLTDAKYLSNIRLKN